MRPSLETKQADNAFLTRSYYNIRDEYETDTILNNTIDKPKKNSTKKFPESLKLS